MGMEFYLLVLFILFGLGLLYLSLSADLLVRGASLLARALGVGPFIVGATIVAYGTSLPEMVVNSFASFKGAGSLALGNVVGSNLMNTGLILGLAVVISPIYITRRTSKSILSVELPFNFGLTMLVGIMGLGVALGRVHGLILLVVMAAYMILTVRKGLADRKETKAAEKSSVPPSSATDYFMYTLSILCGLAGLTIAARVMVDSAIVIAQLLGMSHRMIGLTIVAVGTSLPELAAALVAAIKKEHSLILGNLVGSNLFNLGLVLGTSAMIRPILIEQDGRLFDFGFLIANAIMIGIFMMTKNRISRLEGSVLITCYLIFILLLVS